MDGPWTMDGGSMKGSWRSSENRLEDNQSEISTEVGGFYILKANIVSFQKIQLVVSFSL